MSDNPAIYTPAVVYAIVSLAVGVNLLTACWAALVRKPLVQLPLALAVLAGLVFTLFPDGRNLTINWDVLFRLVFNVVSVYALANLIGVAGGDALFLYRRRAAELRAEEAPAPAPEPALAGEEAEEKPAGRCYCWLGAFRASWFRPGPI